MSEVIEVEVLDPEKPIAAYNPIKAGIAALTEKYGKTVFSVATTKEMDATKAARAEIREVRYNVEHIRKQLKAPALAYSKRIDAEAAEYTESLLKIEAPIDEVIKAEEERKAAEKAERERVEAARRKAIDERMWSIGQSVVGSVGLSSVKIAAVIDTVQAEEVTLDAFGDRAGEAEIAKQQALAKLQEMHTAAVAQETEAARLKAEREELQRQKAAQEKAAADARRVEDGRIAAERAKLAAEQAEAKRIREAEAEKLRKEREAEEAKQAAERKRQADAQAEIDRQRAEFEAEKAAAIKAEEDRKAAAAKAEQDRKDAEAKAAQDKIDAEARAAKEKADAERSAQEAKAKADADEVARRERVQFEQNGPGYDEIVTVLAAHYFVTEQVVAGWLANLNSNVDDAQLVA